MAISTDNQVIINGVTYAPISSPGKRAVVVVDRGWIFAGDVTEDGEDIRLSRAVHVFRWSEIGFSGVIEHPEKVDLRPMSSDVVVPKASVIFKVPVGDDWGV